MTFLVIVLIASNVLLWNDRRKLRNASLNAVAVLEAALASSENERRRILALASVLVDADDAREQEASPGQQ
jgi:hypothetical protein